MNRTLAFKVAYLKLVLLGTALPNVWDNAASSPITNLYVSLHTADPVGNDQTSNETTYGSYGRVAVPRTSGGWTIDDLTGIVVPAATIVFATPTSGSGTITHVGVGKSVSGAGYLFWSGAVLPLIYITTSVAPRLTTGSQISTG